jgi:hypothetical protein
MAAIWSLQTPLCAEKKFNKIGNLVNSRFYDSILLIMQLQHFKRSVTMVVIPYLQHI